MSGAGLAVVQLPELALTIAGYLKELLDQLDGLLLRVSLKDGKTADYLL
jgi:hypothetical protein